MTDNGAMDFMELSEQRIVVRKKPWMEKKKMELVTSVDMLRRVVDECLAVKYYGIDLETTGLDRRVFDGRTVDKIVGYCLAPNVDTGYYVPVRHKEGASYNLPISDVIAEMKRLVAGDSVGVFHNACFDHEFLEYGEAEPIGEWDDRDRFEDTQLMAYLDNSRRKSKELKDVTGDVLGWEMIKLRDLFPSNHPKHMLDFSQLDPSEDGPVLYGCSDAICTLALFHHFNERIYKSEFPELASQKTVYLIEKMCVPSVRWMERSRLPLDMNKVRELIRVGQDDLVDALTKLYEAVKEKLGRDVRPAWVKLFQSDYPKMAESIRIDKDLVDEYRAKALRIPIESRDPTTSDGKISKIDVDGKKVPAIYDVKSPAQLGQMLHELGIDMPETPSGQGISTKKEDLDKAIEKHGELAYMKHVSRFREVDKTLGNFLFPMERHSDKRDNSLWVQFKQHGTDTGRFATPGKRDEGQGLHGGTTMNLHSLPSKDKKGKVECMRRIRETISSRQGKVLVAIDFSGVELRIVTNLSREPKWIKAFFECSTCGSQYPRDPENPPPAYCYKCGDDRIGDLHTISGIAFYGADATEKDDWKEKRGYAKNSNFALLFGGTGNTVSSRVGCDRNEGWRIFKQFNSTYKVLKDWQKNQVAHARKYGFVATAFGRRYPCPDIAHEEKWVREKNERNAINGPVQAGSADITKLSMGLSYRLCKERNWFGKVNLLITIHDELVFEIDEDIFEEAVEEIAKTMTASKPLMGLKWPVPLLVDVEFGRDWSVPYDRKDWTFQRKELLIHKNKKGKDVPGWPDWALGLFSEKSIDQNVTTRIGGPAQIQSEASGEVESSEPPPDERINGMKPSEVLVYKVHRPLTFGCIDDMAKVVVKSVRGVGTRKLRIETPDGKVLVSEDDGFLVNGVHFYAHAESDLEGI